MGADPTVQGSVPAAPPYVPARTAGWPRRRFPRWLYAAAAALLAIAVAIALVHKPTRAQRAADLRAVLTELTTDIESCAGGVSESLTALRAIQAGAGTSAADVRDAIIIAQTGAANCSPANNELIANLENYQVPESLASFRLAAAVRALIDWAAPNAERVQTDVAQLLMASTVEARSQAQAALSQAIAALDSQRAAVNSALGAAISALGLHDSGPRLPG